MESMKSERSRPLVPLTAIWEKDSIAKYPETVRIPMDDGHVVDYRIDVEQPHPSFLRAMDIVASIKEGAYQYEKKPLAVTAANGGDESNGAERITIKQVHCSTENGGKQWLKRIRAFLRR